ncbi:hypothetical protein [Nostoc commune]|uniref:hypothetical protein n=1 Tax=Nostoc commune TaxID=1178 RepID=UPI0015E81DEE|nr:hypothetical protein [Nostoc commune]
MPFTSQELFSDEAKLQAVPEASFGLGLLAAAMSAVFLPKRLYTTMSRNSDR